MEKHRISQKMARNMAIHAQFSPRKEPPSTLETIEALGYIQIDSISVVERAHHHILWSRNPKYSPSELNQLLLNKSVFEYWSHAASYLPMKDFRFSLPRKKLFQQEKKNYFRVDKKTLQLVKKRIQEEGPLSSKDFKSAKKNSGWFDWAPTKRALEQLFMDGTLMVKQRSGIQKIFDLTENILPSHISTKMPTPSEMAQHLIEKQLSALGLASISEISYLKDSSTKRQITKEIQALLDQGKIIQLQIQSLKDNYYCLSRSFSELTKKDVEKELRILSPFDNLVIQRERLKNLFHYEYQLECYLPPQKRKYGYFCLPLLYGDKFLGSADLKADRKTKQLLVQKLHMEGTSAPKLKLQTALQKFATFNGCSEVLLLD